MVAQDPVRLSEPNDEGTGLVRLTFAWRTLERSTTPKVRKSTLSVRLAHA